MELFCIPKERQMGVILHFFAGVRERAEYRVPGHRR